MNPGSCPKCGAAGDGTKACGSCGAVRLHLVCEEWTPANIVVELPKLRVWSLFSTTALPPRERQSTRRLVVMAFWCGCDGSLLVVWFMLYRRWFTRTRHDDSNGRCLSCNYLMSFKTLMVMVYHPWLILCRQRKPWSDPMWLLWGCMYVIWAHEKVTYL